MEQRIIYSIILFIIGVGLLIIGFSLIEELIIKFLKFAIGLLLIFIAIPMILGSIGVWRYYKHGKVTRFYKNG